MSATDLYFGAPGDLSTIPHPRGGVQSTRVRPSSVFATAAGGVRVGQTVEGRRQFSLNWTQLWYETYAALEAFFHGQEGPGPFVLHDPGRINWLTVNQSGATSQLNGVGGFGHWQAAGLAVGVETPGSGYISTPDTAALDITGDIDIRAEATADDWITGINQTLIAKHETTSQRSWIFLIDEDGRVQLSWSTDGSNLTAIESTEVPVLTNGERVALRMTLDVNDGSGNRVARFYTAPAIEGPWTQLGSTVTTAGTTSIFSSTSELSVGARDLGSTQRFGGVIHAIEVRSGLGGVRVAEARFDRQLPGTTVFTDDTGLVWSIQGEGAELTGGYDETDNITSSASAYHRGPRSLRWDLNPPTDSYLDLVNTSGGYVSTPDNAALDITGDIDIRVEVTLEDWTPLGTATLVSKWGAAGSRSYLIQITTAGVVTIAWSTDGTAVLAISSTATPGFTDGERGAVRVTLDVDNGAAGRTATFYTSDSIDGTWTQFDQVTTATATSIFNSGTAVEIGGHTSGTADLWTGKVHAVYLLNGISGTTVASPKFYEEIAGTTSFSDDAGRTWTVNGSAEIRQDPPDHRDSTNTENFGLIQVQPATPTWPGIPVIAGQAVCFAFYVRSGVSFPTDLTARLRWLDSDGELVSESDSSPVAASPTWQQISVTATPPATAIYVLCQVEATEFDTYLGNVLFFDEFQLERGSSATSWRPGTGIYPVTVLALSELWPWQASDYRESPVMVLQEVG